MIDELRATLTQKAERVTPAPDPYGRLLRRRRHRRQLTSTLAAVLALAIILPGGWLASHHDRGSRQRPSAPPPLIAQLVASPTLGSLAADAAYLRQLRQRARDYENSDGNQDGRTPPPGAATGTVGQVVLFAGDVPGNQRLALVTVDDPFPEVLIFLGTKGTTAAHLAVEATQVLAPVLNLTWTAVGKQPDGSNDYHLVLGPAGSQIQLGTDPRYLADGSVRRTWTPVPGGYLVKAARDLALRTRVRVSLAGTPLYEGGLSAPLGGGSHVPIDPGPVDGGTPEPVAAQQVADTVANTTGLTPATAHFEVLWSAEIPMAGLPDSRTAIIATVLARTPDGGGVYTTLSFDPADPNASARDHPTGSGILGDPSRSLIAMRLPWYSGVSTTDQLQIVAPPSAVKAEIVRDGAVVASGGLDRGAGQLRLALPASVTIRTYDAAGTLVAQRDFVDNESNRTDLYEPEITNW